MGTSALRPKLHPTPSPAASWPPLRLRATSLGSYGLPARGQVGEGEVWALETGSESEFGVQYT